MYIKGTISKHHDLIYDVGMHKGEDTDFYLRKGFRVIGFEADPDLVKYCQNKFLDQIKDKRVTIIEGAIVRHRYGESLEQTIKFYKNQQVSVWGTVWDQWAHRNERLGTASQVIEVKTVDFTKCLEEYGIPYYMKIDIEGSDTICLQALCDFEIKPTYISIESEMVVFAKLLEELNLLEQLGYTEYKAVQQATISSQVEPYPSQEGCYTGYPIKRGSSGLFGNDLPGRWKNKEEIIREYKFIFLLYRLFAHYGILSRSAVGKLLKRMLEKVLRRPIPGWYDTHGKHSSLTS